MSRSVIAILTAASLGLGLTSLALGDTSAEDAQKYRISVMTVLRGHISAASMIVRGLVEDDGYLEKHADGLLAGAEELGRVFPSGSNVGDSEALPVIWEEPEKFAKAIEEARVATQEFHQAAASGDSDAIRAAFRSVGDACRGCHDRYRVDED